MAWIQTNSGGKFTFNAKRVNPKEIKLEDIAHALSYTCRYNGHCHAFYSVAEHSLNMAEYLLRTNMGKEGKPTARGYKLADQALLHDAAEAYCGDMTRPLKQLFPEFDAYEKKVMRAILKKYLGNSALDPEVKQADSRIMLNEKEALFPKDQQLLWGLENLTPLEGVAIHAFTPPDVYGAYLKVLKDRFGDKD